MAYTLTGVRGNDDDDDEIIYCAQQCLGGFSVETGNGKMALAKIAHII